MRTSVFWRGLALATAAAFAFPLDAAADPRDEQVRAAIYQDVTDVMKSYLKMHPPKPNLTDEELGVWVRRYSDGLTDCNMRALRLLPPSLSDIVYNTIGKGGSFRDAQAAMDDAVHAEMFKGGLRQAKMRDALDAEAEASVECAHEVMGP